MSPGARAARGAIAFLVAALALAPVALHAGWPYDHDWLRPLLRAGEIAGQWRLFHLIPVWSTGTQDGYGSPSPILYQKLFTDAAAVLVLAGIGPKATMLATLAGFMVAGFLGAGLCVRVARGRADLALEAVAGLVLVTCRYATTDWLVRGAVAEFSAIMLLPLLFACCLRLVASGRVPGWRARAAFGGSVALVWFAHSGIGLFALLVPAIALAIVVARAPGGRRLAIAAAALRDLAAAALVTVVLVLPWLLPALSLGRYADLHALVAFETPAHSHVGLWRLFDDTPWRWGAQWGSMSLQLDPLLIAALVLLPLLIARDARQRANGVFLLLVALVVLALQTRAALPVFALPGLAYLQFSWRLLGLFSVATSVALALLIGLVRSRGARGLAVALVAVPALAGRDWRPAPALPWFPPAALRDAVHGIATRGVEQESGEYLPHVAPRTGAILRWIEAHDAATGLCVATPLGSRTAERATLAFADMCAPGTEIALPVFDAPGLRVTQDGHDLDFHRTCDDPRIRVSPRGGGPVVVVPPGWWSASRASLLGSPATAHPCAS